MTRMRSADKRQVRKVALRMALAVSLGVAGISLAMRAAAMALLAVLP